MQICEEAFALLPEEGVLPGLPPGWSADVTYYPDQCRILIRTPPGEGGRRRTLTVSLADLPRLYVEALAEMDSRA